MRHWLEIYEESGIGLGIADYASRYLQHAEQVTDDSQPETSDLLPARLVGLMR